MPRLASVPQLADDIAPGYRTSNVGLPYDWKPLAGDRQQIISASPSADTAVSSSGVACFAAGTLISAVGGLVPIEALRVGDRVATFGERKA